MVGDGYVLYKKIFNDGESYNTSLVFATDSKYNEVRLKYERR